MDYRPAALTSRRDIRDFLLMPWTVYRGDPHWVPPLLAELRNKLNPRRNPFFEYGRVKLFGVRDGRGRLVSRGASVLNPRHNAKYGDRTGFFGLFESLNDPEAARLLFRLIEAELRSHGCDRIVGPVNFTTNDESGVLVEGFGMRPAFMTNYSPPYYDPLLRACGLTKEMDLFSYGWSDAHVYPDRYERFVDVLRSRRDIRFRSIDRRRLAEELEKVRDVYNASFSDVWGFVPLTPAETADMGKAFRLIADDDMVFFAEIGGRPAGFCLALPDIHEILAGLDGRLWPLGILRILSRRRKIRTIRVIVLGVLPEHRAGGVAALLIDQLRKAGRRRGYRSGELSVVLESNRRMTGLLESLGFSVIKRYRIYQSPIGDEVRG